MRTQQPRMFLPYFVEDQSICPAKALEEYIKITHEIRGDIDYLLITFKKPYKQATAQTISRWIKSVLCESGIDTKEFKAHSTRHASTSNAKYLGVSLDIIRKTAGWSKSSENFAKFYNRPIEEDNNFANYILSAK
ncbi:unnamed protein product [Parnassius mnemosyne]|uniref:Tyr recombinase domain-containing protein n=1 Tax=Parnassius mnemosyne TaxID=213953 RepID=A0AAV1LK65_9NEOP